MIKHYLNLKNGLDWMKDIPIHSFIRIESTAIEKEDWNRILRDLDSDFLMNLAIGNTCHVYDCGTNREISKTISVGIPFIKNYLNDIWILRTKIPALTKEEREIKRKLNYFHKFLNTDTIKLFGHSRLTAKDNDKAYWRELALYVV